jgi:hypothetical protein
MSDRSIVEQRRGSDEVVERSTSVDEHIAFCDDVAHGEEHAARYDPRVISLPPHLLAPLLALVRAHKNDPFLLRAGRDELREIEMILDDKIRANRDHNGD